MTCADGSKKVKYNEADILILEILGNDYPAVQGLDNTDFQGEDIIISEIQSEADVPNPEIPSTSYDREERSAVRKSELCCSCRIFSPKGTISLDLSTAAVAS